MPLYTIETPSGRKLKIEANDEQTAMAGAQQWHDDTDAVVRTVWGEARSDPDSQAGVASVILNRSKLTGQRPREVVTAKGQFEPWGNPQTRQQLEALDPRSPEYQDILNRVSPVLSGEDVTGGATHFYAPKAQAALGRQPPKWDDGSGRDMGQHRFFTRPAEFGGKVELGEVEFTSAPAQEPTNQTPEQTGVVYQDTRRGLPQPQYQYVRQALSRGEFDRSAKPGSRKLPYFQQSPNDPVPDAAYWVDLSGKLHEPQAAPSKHAGDPAYQQARARIGENQTLRGRSPIPGMTALGDFTDQIAASTGAQDEVNAGLAYLMQGGENLIRRGLGQDIAIPARTAARAAMDDTRDRQKVYAARNPGANVAATGLGIMASGRPTGGQIIAQRPLAAGARAATLQAPFAVARQEGTVPQRLPGAAVETATAFGLGSAATAGANALQRSATRAAARPVSDARQLSREGIRLTPGQMLGGMAQRTEDALTSAPLTGMAINARRTEGLEDFNRVVINRGLGEVGETLPRKVVGREAVKAADAAVSRVYDDALRGVRVVRDPQFQNDIAQVAARPLPTQEADQLGAVLSRYDELAAPGTGEAWKRADSHLASAIRAADAASATNPAAPSLRDALVQTRLAHKGLLERTSPAALEAVERADAATANLVRAREASTKTGARKGIFTPAQLNQAVRSADSSGAKRAYRQGDALMQDLTDAGVSALPSTIPDSGTALRLGAIGALGGASTINPIFGQALMADAAGAALYSRPVQAMLNAIYRGSDPVAARAALAQLGMLASRDPALLPVYEAAARQAVALPQQRGGQPNAQRRPQVPMIPQAPIP